MPHRARFAEPEEFGPQSRPRPRPTKGHVRGNRHTTTGPSSGAPIVFHFSRTARHALSCVKFVLSGDANLRNFERFRDFVEVKGTC